MKKTILITSAIMLFSNLTMGQGFLEKKFSQLATAANSKSYSKGDIADAEKDSASNFLEAKENVKDTRNTSGIYYSTTPIFCTTDLDKKKVVKKFLVQYNEVESFNNSLSIYTQHAYEATNRAKLVIPSHWSSSSSPASLNIKMGIEAGGLYLNGKNYESKKYEFINHSSKKDLQGNEIPDADYLSNWYNCDLIEIEPGIILIGNFSVTVQKSATKQDEYEVKDAKELASNKKYNIICVLYKADKANQAKLYTNDYAWDKVVAYKIKLKKVGTNTGGDNKLPNPRIGNINIPMFASFTSVAVSQAQKLLNDKGLSHLKVLYVYSAMQSDNFYTREDYRIVLGSKTKVRVGRYVEYFVVFENTKPQPRVAGDEWISPSKFGYLSLNVCEDMKDNAYNINEYSGVIYSKISGPMWLSKDENAMRFKK